MKSLTAFVLILLSFAGVMCAIALPSDVFDIGKAARIWCGILCGVMCIFSLAVWDDA